MKNVRHKVKIDKRYLKSVIVGELNYGKALGCLVDNSLKAYENNFEEKTCCEVVIGINQDLIYIKDKSGGISTDISDEDVFKIGNRRGTGIKKAVFKLGNEITIESRSKSRNRNLYLDFDAVGDELVFFSRELIDEEVNKNFGTEIFISSLDQKTLKDINSGEFLEIIEKELSKSFGRKILSNTLKITLEYMGEKRVIPSYVVHGDFIGEKTFDDLGIVIKVYKKAESEIKGVDFYVNDYLIYDRKEMVKIVQSNYNFKDCVAEVISYGEVGEIFQNESVIIDRLEGYIRENSIYFKSKIKGIQYEADLNKAEEMMEYYDLRTAKALGEKSFEILYNHYKDEISRKF